MNGVIVCIQLIWVFIVKCFANICSLFREEKHHWNTQNNNKIINDKTICNIENACACILYTYWNIDGMVEEDGGGWVLMKMVRLNMTVSSAYYANCFPIQSFNYIRQHSIFHEAYQSIFYGRLFSTLNLYLVNTHFTIYTFNRLALFTMDFQWFWQTLPILLMFHFAKYLVEDSVATCYRRLPINFDNIFDGNNSKLNT